MLGLRTLVYTLLAAVAVPSVSADLIQYPKSSAAQPYDVHSDMPLMSLAAGLTQQTYCPSSNTHDGMDIGGAKLLWHTGDGFFIQRALIYHSDQLGIAVAYQGTNADSLVSALHDVNFPAVPLDWRYRAGAPQDAKVAFGFQNAYIEIVDKVYPKVKEFMEKYNEDRLTVIGHSLGASMALISSVDFNYRIKQGVHNVYLFGLPRTGNQVFADFVDKTFGKHLHWAVNGRDWVPHVPPREFGFQHPSNYIWINPANSTHYKHYPGQENVHGFNSITPEWLSFDDHQGHYFHTQIGANLGHCPATVGQD